MHPFSVSPSLIGMVHLRALPGTPFFQNNLQAVFDQALAEAHLLAEAGFDGIMIENMHDIPYQNQTVGPETTAMMTAVAVALKKAIDLPMGVQVLAGANKEALSVALAAGFQWIRAEGYVFGHVGDEGYIDAQAGELLRFRRNIRADRIQVWTDIKKKHSSHAVTADVDIVETAKAAAFFASQGLILTGSSTGTEANLDEIGAVREAVDKPIIIGSGITVDNLEKYVGLADAFIVGSSLKVDGVWNQPMDRERVRALVAEMARLRASQ